MRGFPRRSEGGFTLVEVLAALTVFSVVTIGIAPLIGSSLRGTAMARSSTLGKNVAVEAMERVRGLPFFISYGTKASKVDVLDLYFPCADPTMALSACAGGGTRSYVNTGEDAGTFTIVCSPTSVDPACATDVPEGYTLTYTARFVGLNGTDPVLPSSSAPPGIYAWDSPSQMDSPPSQLLHMTVTANWTVGSRALDARLESLVGDRKFGEISVAGSATIGYGVQVLTRFVDSLGTKSDLSAIGGSAESSIESRLVSTARQSVRAAEIRLVEEPTTANPSGRDLGLKLGQVTEFSAPPTSSAPDATTVATPPMTHPSLLGPPEIAQVLDTTSTGVQVSVANELPVATGGFSFGAESDNLGFFWVQNEADLSNDAALHLDKDRKVVALRTKSGATLTGSTEAVTGAVGSTDRRVETKATVNLKEARLFPVTFIQSGVDDPSRSVMQIRDFQAQVRCKSTANSTTAVAEASWTATLRYWRDTTPDDGVVSGSFADVPLAFVGDGSNSDTDLRTLIGSNPLVYDAVLPTDDVYLFTEGLSKGYFDNIRFKAPVTNEDDGGNLTTASVGDAITMTTTRTNPTKPESGISISIGNINCEALDLR